MDFSQLFNNSGNQGGKNNNPLADILADIAKDSQAKMESSKGDGFPSDMPEELKGLLDMLASKGAKVEVAKVEGLSGLAKMLEEMTGGGKSAEEEKAEKLFIEKYGSREEYMKVHFPNKVKSVEGIVKDGLVQQLSGTSTKIDTGIMASAFVDLAKEVVMSDLAKDPMRAMKIGLSAAALATTTSTELDAENPEESYTIIIAMLSVVYMELMKIQANRDAQRLMK